MRPDDGFLLTSAHVVGGRDLGNREWCGARSEAPAQGHAARVPSFSAVAFSRPVARDAPEFPAPHQPCPSLQSSTWSVTRIRDGHVRM
ncbi:hypothetical protein FDG2_6561 [Candidatus Protofrankia californiensis]|uniref:Uncharacterized protein n=1 Tax=Candidatus Protofrankia californiensis TaxID=1839754 RepID=A0A1C3PHA8_9ACTN|nr:hypothetical protein FDG2_6561 [Candidatus Protofrankia californiensis]